MERRQRNAATGEAAQVGEHAWNGGMRKGEAHAAAQLSQRLAYTVPKRGKMTTHEGNKGPRGR